MQLNQLMTEKRPWIPQEHRHTIHGQIYAAIIRGEPDHIQDWKLKSVKKSRADIITDINKFRQVADRSMLIKAKADHIGITVKTLKDLEAIHQSLS